VKALSAECDGEIGRAEVIPISNGSPEYLLEFIANPDLPVGPIRGTIVLTAALSDGKTYSQEVLVEGQVVPDVLAIPGIIRFHPSSTDLGSRRTEVVLRSRRQAAFDVRSVGTDSPRLTVSRSSPDGPATVHTFTVQCDTVQATDDRCQLKWSLATESDGLVDLVVPVVFSRL